ncbi:hypothetical protein GCM10010095_70910 [Streptomyces anthocyanicus]|uniref:Uncharacterized protein n=1 Tax=Streptomyces violaceolatus TaxID=67378 RepID=A0ABN3TCV4_9ACTN|nr:hypothetical protein GCM10010095_70910 [Streptomyces anthocyanicus]
MEVQVAPQIPSRLALVLSPSACGTFGPAVGNVRPPPRTRGPRTGDRREQENPEVSMWKCQRCKGNGKCTSCDGSGSRGVWKCDSCRGSGDCKACDGRG